jgi:hypothetical protein
MIFARILVWSLGVRIMTSMSTDVGPLPERVEKAARERIAAGTYQTLVFAVVDGDKSEVVAFGKLDNGEAPDGETVYEIGSVTKTFTATLLRLCSRGASRSTRRWHNFCPISKSHHAAAPRPLNAEETSENAAENVRGGKLRSRVE